VSDAYVTVDGLRLRVRVVPGTGQPLLLINGLGGCLEGWEPLADRLPGRALVMIDHPGTGLSQVPARMMPVPELAALYFRVLDELQLDRVDVLGFSFGGVLAQQMAVADPRRVCALILAGTACGWGGVPADPLTLMAASFPLRHRFPLIREMSAPIIYRGRAGRNPALFTTELRGINAHRASMQGVMYQIAGYSMWSSANWLHLLRQPTLVLAGDEDPMAPVANSHLLAARIPKAELRVFDQAGHLFLFDLAEEAAPVITDFLTRTAAVPAGAQA
jgi:pimeloyl-ACP methyl ester carboxylesterase